jgi:5-methylcytosine-specific restriction endonuclease McrA
MTLQKKADKVLQETIRKLYPFCEVCGKPTQVGHHFFPKSISSRLRYVMDNIAHLCNGCHMRHHQAGDPRIHETIKRNRGGDKWFDRLEKMKSEYVKVDKFFYENAIIELEKLAKKAL